MRVDIGNALDGALGMDRAALESLDDRVADAHERVRRGRADREFGYAALALPTDCDPEAIRDTAARVRNRVEDVEVVCTVGIGGSALGAATITDALPTDARHVTLDNVDPAWVSDRVDDLPLDRTVVNVVSRSGTTAETLANFLVVREAMANAGVDWRDHTVFTTGDDGPLARLAARHSVPTLPVPEGVPGRFSALSTVGLFAPAVAGVAIDRLLAGGARAADRLAGSVFETPGYAYGAVTYALAERGATVNAVMPYAESLDRLAEWIAQLWAESLGKDGRGQTPVRAMGVTDQHSQLQLYRAGPTDKLVSLLRVRDGPDRPLPTPDAEELAYLREGSLRGLADAEFRATEASLAAADRENVRIELPKLTPEQLGETLYAFEAACILHGELADVATFTQPAVEWGKRAARALLADEDTSETRTVAGKRELVVGDE